MKSKFITTNAFAYILILFVSSAFPVKSDAFPITNKSIPNKGPSTYAAAPKHSSAWTQRSYRLCALDHPIDASLDEKSNHNRIDLLNIRGGDATSASFIDKTKTFVSKNFFLVGMFVAVSLAKLYPEVRIPCVLIEFGVCF